MPSPCLPACEGFNYKKMLSEKHRKNIGKGLLKAYREGRKKSVLPKIPWNKGKKGLQIAWNKGLKRWWKSPGEFKKGVHYSPKTEFKKGQFSKEKHPMWKGGVTPIVRLLRESVEYHLWRAKILKRDNYTCWICEKRGEKLHTHHLKKFSDYPKLRFDIGNGIILCQFCHKTYTKFRK